MATPPSTPRASRSSSDSSPPPIAPRECLSPPRRAPRECFSPPRRAPRESLSPPSRAPRGFPLSSPPPTPGFQRTSPPSTPALFMGRASPPSTPGQGILTDKTTPPAAAAPATNPLKFRSALISQNLEMVQKLVEDDPVLTLVPIKTKGKAEHPLLFALRERCKLPIIKFLLSAAGPPSEQLGTTSLIFLSKSVASLFDKNFEKAFTFNECSSIWDSSSDEEPSAESLKSLQFINDYEVSVATCLLRYGANPYLKDADGLSAIEYARREGKLDLADVMDNWNHWQQSCFHYHLGIIPLQSNIARNVYGFLIPTTWKLEQPMADLRGAKDQ